MESVINPMVFYWINLLRNVNASANIVGVVATLIMIAFAVLWVIASDSEAYDNGWTEKERKAISKGFKISAIVTIISLVVVTIIPSRETMLMMLVADMVTYENIELTKDSAIALIDYIVQQVQAITSEG